MTSDSDIKLDPRIGGIGIFHVGTYQIGDPIDLHDETIAFGHTATLHSGKVHLIARIIEVNGDSFKGEIVGFDNYDEYEYMGKKPGDSIEFTEPEIHGLMR